MINAPVKFYMYFNGERIRTLDDLRENFIAEDVLEAYNSGQLAKWLKVWRHKEELAQVEAIESESAREILRELVRIFDPEAEAEEIDAELSVYDYLEERKKFREHLMTHGLGELETLRRERDTLKQENDRLKSELEASKRSYSSSSTSISSSTRGWHAKRVTIPEGKIQRYSWMTIVPSGTACRIVDVGNCGDKLFVDNDTKYHSSRSMEFATSYYNKTIFQGISVFFRSDRVSEDLYFYYEEV